MYIRVKNFDSRLNAEVGKGLLEAHGINSIVSADDVGGMRPDIGMATGGAWLLVDEKDVKKAKGLLENR